MRYFVFFDPESTAVVQTLASMAVPGDGPNLPENCLEVTVEDFLRAPGCTVVDGAIVNPAPRLRTFSKVQFLNLFTAEERSAIRLYRRSNVDDDVEDFYEMLQMATDPINPNQPATAALLSAGLGLLVSKGLITAPEAARIAAGTPPA